MTKAAAGSAGKLGPGDYEKLVASERERRLVPTFSPGSVTRCPDCGKKTFEWTNRLSRVVPQEGRVAVLKNLTGCACSNCGLEALDHASLAMVRAEEERAVPADYAVKLARQGEKRAIFLNKDLMRVARPDDVEEVLVAPVDRDHWLVRFVRRGRPRRKESRPSPTAKGIL